MFCIEDLTAVKNLECEVIGAAPETETVKAVPPGDVRQMLCQILHGRHSVTDDIGGIKTGVPAKEPVHGIDLTGRPDKEDPAAVFEHPADLLIAL